jgi:hypothetical protein
MSEVMLHSSDLLVVLAGAQLCGPVKQSATLTKESTQMVTNKDLVENTEVNNGMSEAAILEIKTRQAEKDGNSFTVSPSAAILNAGLFNRATAAADFYVNVKGKAILVPKGSTVSPLRMNKTRTLYRARIMGVAGVPDMEFIIMPVSYTTDDGVVHSTVTFPGDEANGGGPKEKKESTPTHVVDEIEQAMIDAFAKCGERNPLKYDPKDKKKVTDWGHYGEAVANWSTDDWKKAFPGYTPSNIRTAFQAIQKFRVSRQAMIDSATTDDAIMAAVKEYRRAKSYEQELCSVAGKCGLI